jgi:hypothetical protein
MVWARPSASCDLRFPAELSLGKRDVGAALFRVIRGQRQVHHLHLGAGELQHALGQFQHGELMRVAEVDRPGVTRVGLHQPEKAVDQVVHIAE